MAIVENRDFLASELLNYRDFDCCAFDKGLPDNRIPVVANQEDIGNIKTLIDFVREFFDIEQCANFSAKPRGCCLWNCIDPLSGKRIRANDDSVAPSRGWRASCATSPGRQSQMTRPAIAGRRTSSTVGV